MTTLDAINNLHKELISLFLIICAELKLDTILEKLNASL